MSEIAVTYHWRDIPDDRISRSLVRRVQGFMAPAATVAIVIAVGAAVFWFTRDTTGRVIDPVGNLSLAVFFLALTGLFLVRYLTDEAIAKARTEAPIRQRPASVVLTAEGVRADGGAVVGQIPWCDITEVRPYDQGVLLLISAVEYVPVPDAALPDQMTRADLLTQIEAWRA